MKKLLQGSNPVFLFLVSPKDQCFRLVRFDMVMTLLVMVTCLALQMVESGFATKTLAAAVPATPAIHTEVIQQVEPKPEQPPAAPAPPETTPRVVVAPAPSCTANTLYTSTPGRLDLGRYSEGLAVVRDEPYYYQVSGATMSELRAQVVRCGPRHEFAGESSYSINWSYAFIADETGLCRVVGVKVGVHTAMLLPDGPAIARWQAFADGLMAHERGHGALSEEYGARLLNALRAYSASDCYTMSPAVEATARDVMAQHAAAQEQYDAATGHGATQGAAF